MKCKILLLTGMTCLVVFAQAQKSKKNAPSRTTGYAITSVEKGGRSWKEVRLVDLGTGEVLKTVFESQNEAAPLNARTGEPITRKDPVKSAADVTVIASPKKVVNLDHALDNHRTVERRVIVHRRSPVSTTAPFATNSAACALDEKNQRLYYTPMGINQLRYIDLRSGKIYFFEDEDFGKVAGSHDVNNQITRMVIASDGHGYALTNDARTLLRFTTGKKPTITDLGTLSDDPSNKRSVHASGNYGGDMVADHSGNLYLVTAYRHVYLINIESKVATYKGAIKGLPQGFTTNGAMVEEDAKVIIASSESTLGYFRFDLNTLEAEKMTGDGQYFNASDLANGNLAFDKKKKKKNDTPPAQAKATNEEPVSARNNPPAEVNLRPGISVYPNPVTEGMVRLSFADQPAGRYRVQLLDISGRVIRSQEVNINGPAQIETLRFPELSVKGSYLVQVTNEVNKVHVTEKVVVQ